MNKVTLHMGLWKTGTTFLQKKVFKGSEYAGMHISPPEVVREFQQMFMHASPSYWKTASGEELVKSLMIGKSLYSAENLYRAKVFKQTMDRGVSGVEPTSFVNHVKSISDVLKNNGLDLQVLFFFRRQPEWMASMYSEMSRSLNNPCQEDFENRIKLMAKRPWRYGDHVVKYDLLHEALSDVLGKDRVIALPYEKLMGEENVVVFRRFTGIDSFAEDVSNVSVSKVNNKSTGENLWSLWDKDSEVHAPGRLYLNDSIRKTIFDHYLQSNVNFQNHVACDLKELGYI